MADPFGSTSRAFRDFGSLTREQLATTIPALHKIQMGLAQPLLNQITQAGQLQGQQLGQNVQGSLSALGGGSSGIGAITGGLAGSLGSSFGMQARMGLLQQILGQSVSGGLGLVGQTQAGAQQLAFGSQQQPSALQQFGNFAVGAGSAAAQFPKLGGRSS